MPLATPRLMRVSNLQTGRARIELTSAVPIGRLAERYECVDGGGGDEICGGGHETRDSISVYLT